MNSSQDPDFSSLPTIPLWVNNETLNGSSKRSIPVFNPATGKPEKRVTFASDDDLERALAVAAEAFQSWAAVPAVKRARLLFRFKQLVERDHDLVARLISEEHGKTVPDAAGEVLRGLEVIEFACGIPQLLKGEYSPQVSAGVDSFSIRQPLGVAVGITPFNFPVMVPMWMFPIAIACGNCFVLKPSERDPSPSLHLARLLAEAGVPPGVLTVLHGDAELVGRLIAHPTVAAVSFVGSTPVAESIYRQATFHGKRVQALGGAKNHLVILPDADLDQTVDALIGSAFGSAGERCMAISVAVPVGAQVADELVGRLKPRVAALRIGPGDQIGCEMGPLVTEAHRERVAAYLDLGVNEGARLVVDGRGAALPSQGFFLGGSLFDHVTPNMRVYQEEIFGPVLSIVRAPNLDEAIRLVNAHPYGNGVALFTRDSAAARRFMLQVNVGMVGINVPIPVPMAFHSFGGWKRSLFGDHHVHGPEGVRFYTRLKNVTARWPGSAVTGAGAAFVMPTAT
jgi:malonate-semialdehyde dehydrogenase (acetylating)/methylmalonate-semialdehyde dehydrogenase